MQNSRKAVVNLTELRRSEFIASRLRDQNCVEYKKTAKYLNFVSAIFSIKRKDS
jgi:hypothetical protein